MAQECELRLVNDMPGVDCDEDECIYWRVAGHLGVAEYTDGCAIQHFELLDDGAEVAAWLLTVKQRVEGQLPS